MYIILVADARCGSIEDKIVASSDQNGSSSKTVKRGLIICDFISDFILYLADVRMGGCRRCAGILLPHRHAAQALQKTSPQKIEQEIRYNHLLTQFEDEAQEQQRTGAL